MHLVCVGLRAINLDNLSHACFYPPDDIEGDEDPDDPPGALLALHCLGQSPDDDRPFLVLSGRDADELWSYVCSKAAKARHVETLGKRRSRRAGKTAKALPGK